MKAKTVKAKETPKATHEVVKGKPSIKAVAQPVAQPKAKSTVKPAPAAKSAPHAAAKPSVSKAAPVKPSVPTKIVGKEPKPAAKAAVKVTKVVKASPVRVVKPTAIMKAKDSVKTTLAKAAKPEVAAPKISVAPAVAPVKTAVAPVAPAAPSVPVRAGRPSSRLAQLTVPSMAQSVASTAAKASFTQTVDKPYIVPPVASAVKKDPALVNNWKLKPVDQLTEAELIAMPDDEYMNETQLAFFRRVLNTLKQDILSNAGQTTEHLRADTVVVPDPADRATIEEEHALELRTRDRERKLLKKIEQSLARIDSGDYGYCDETGEAIGVGRLLARPTANLSLEAQQRRELKQKMFGD
ncbi:RNA polymerase-binding protein DksA [Rhodoferax sp.]|uniref:RNA polymerase-binding protein DksA n=1 Tax=Rhodoferax sp. TaxID=50421 RepID=UPI0025F5A020|nr:RNA polymerase-binding protein DksA [Rhodoferax sp.]